MKRHGNIAVFIPHLGCVHACSFCGQQRITGVEKPMTPKKAEAFLKEAFSHRPDPEITEIAFFGGSFTCIHREEMVRFLECAAPYVQSGACAGIRISTRPDGISGDIPKLLHGYGVKAIELGAQSLDDAVLAKNGRGHTAKQVEEAMETLRLCGYPFSLGLQIMTGLFGDDKESLYHTVEEVLRLHPDTLRIYPTVVLPGTRLETLMKEGRYAPQTVEEAVEQVYPLIPLFEKAGIRVIRVGLHASDILSKESLGGGYHPAFRELCEARLYRELLERALEGAPKGAEVLVRIAPGELSKAIGQKQSNRLWAAAKGYTVRFQPDGGVKRGTLTILV